VQEILERMPGVNSVNRTNHEPQAQRLSFAFEFRGDDKALSGVLGQLIRQGIPVLHFTEEKHDLEELFLQLTQGVVT